MLLDMGADHVVAIEPSDAFNVLEKNTSARASRVTLVHARGEDFQSEQLVDIAMSIGVIHHIQYPAPVLRRMYDRIVKGGRVFVWVYAKEGNELYLAFAKPLRIITTLLPDGILRPLSHALTLLLIPYIFLCKFLPLPMRRYMRNMLSHYDYRSLQLTVFDQLNPAYAKYYSKEEAEGLLGVAGFSNISVHQRHGYSWSILGHKK